MQSGLKSPRIWEASADPFLPESVSEAVSLLRRGCVIVYPTETFYAVGGIPGQAGTVERIFEIKGRGAEKALPLIASGREAVRSAVSDWPEAAERLAGAFWPGPLTLVLPASPLLPPALHAGTGKVAVRISSHPVAAYLAGAAGGLLVSTSANRSGEPAPDDPAGVSDAIGSRVDGFVSAGILPGGFPSTIVDVTTFPAKLLRAGRLGLERILEVLGPGNAG